MTQCACKCSGPKEVDPSVPRLEVATVDFMKVENLEGFIHYAFDGINLSLDDILHNIKVGKGLLQRNDHLVVASNIPIKEKIKIENDFSVEECKLKDNYFYTVIFKKY